MPTTSSTATPHSADGGFQQIGKWSKHPDAQQKMVLCGKKLWFFGQQFLDQPTYHWGHHVTFAGASCDFFDTETNEWNKSGRKAFPGIASTEYLDEVLFVHKTEIYLLLYSHFGQFYAHSLYKFDMNSLTWQKVVDFPEKKNQAPSEDSYKNVLVIVDGQTVDGVYFVSFVEHTIAVHLLKLSSESAKWINIDGTVSDEVNYAQLQPTQAAHANGHIYIQGGVHGCGFRWQPNLLIKFSLENGNSKIIEIGNKGEDQTSKPSFSYHGPFSHAVLPDKNIWLHIAGNNAVAMTGCSFNGQIWTLRDLNTEKPEWVKQPLEIPIAIVPDSATSKVHIIYSPDSGELFLASESIGIFKSHLSI